MAVVGFQTCGGNGVGGLQAAVETGQSVCVFFGLKCGTHGRVGFGQVVQSAGKGLEIHHGAADDKRQPSAPVDVGNQPDAVGDEVGSAVCFQRGDDVDEVVRYGLTLGGAGFGGAYVHVAVDQGGIEADDFHRQFGGDVQRKAGFAAGGGAEDGEGFGCVHE